MSENPYRPENTSQTEGYNPASQSPENPAAHPEQMTAGEQPSEPQQPARQEETPQVSQPATPEQPEPGKPEELSAGPAPEQESEPQKGTSGEPQAPADTGPEVITPRSEPDAPPQESKALVDEALDRELNQAMAGMSDMSFEDMADLADKDEDVEGGSAANTRRGTVVGLHGDDVFIDLGEKDQGVAPLSQFGGKKAQLSIGQAIEVIVDRYDPESGLLICSKPGAIRPASWETIKVGTIVEGRVTGMNKGGLELSLKGIRGFMPASQVADKHVKDISCFINETLRCEVVGVNRRDKSVTVSRRKIEERERAEARETLLDELEAGQIRKGVVSNIMDYGAFVDLGGVDGLVHISDLSYSPVDKVSDVLEPGQVIDVRVLKVDRERERISLGVKQVQPDPWTNVEQNYSVGQQLKVRVTRLADFGAFATLEEGIDGLIPISEMSYSRIARPHEVVQAGQVVDVVVIRVEPVKKRIALSMKQAQPDPWSGVLDQFQPNAIVPGKVTRLTDFGAFIELLPGVEGLAHISELSDKRVKTCSEVVNVGDQVQVRVLNVDMDQRRISLSLKLTDEQSMEHATRAAEPSATPKKKRKKPLRGGLDSDWDWTGTGLNL